MSPSQYDRIMVHYETANHLKLVDFTDAEVKAFVLGVLVIAAKAPIRGAFMVGDEPATAKHVARQANVTVRVATCTITKLRGVSLLEKHADGIEWVHDFHEYNPAPKADDTSAERAKRYRENQKAKRDASRSVTRDDRDGHGTVTPPEGEVEVRSEKTAFSRGGLASEVVGDWSEPGDPGPVVPSNVVDILDGKTASERGAA